MLYLVAFNLGLVSAVRGHPLLFSKQGMPPGCTFSLIGMFGIHHIDGNNFFEPLILQSQCVFSACHPVLLSVRHVPL